MQPVLAKRMKIVLKVAMGLLHSMDWAKGESFESGMGIAYLKCRAKKKLSVNGMKIYSRPRMKYFKIILALFSAYVIFSIAGRNEAKGAKHKMNIYLVISYGLGVKSETLPFLELETAKEFVADQQEEMQETYKSFVIVGPLPLAINAA